MSQVEDALISYAKMRVFERCHISVKIMKCETGRSGYRRVAKRSKAYLQAVYR